MAKPKPEEEAQTPAADRPAKRNRFVGGDFSLEPFGMTTDQDAYKQGFVETADVRALLDEFGLQDRKHIEFPFHHQGKRGGELWSLRIEEAKTHQVGKGHAVSHHWVYKREIPEQVSGAA